ncbi:hypothetical protein [Actinospica robiniae]|uniref:hypothetical protein n=1 Tax=Actinospica robiniae TaxID=304901 RepID=UPI0007C439DD|nr:hypothetical protein [Actinospica robiniae]
MSTLIWRAAGADDNLASAVVSARAARPGTVVEVLADTRHDFALRALRSQVLGSACSDVDVAERWLREEPRSADAQLLYARTAVARAIRSHDAQEPRKRWQALAEMALRACKSAVAAAPDDPTPLVALLTLARLGHTPQPGPEGPDGLAEVVGPWELFDRIRALDSLHREAHVRFLYCLGSDADRLHFALHVANSTPLESDPQLLVLIALVEQYRSKDPKQRAAQQLDWQWRRPGTLQYALDLFERWFPKAQARRFPPVTDYSYLAHALWAGGRTPEAGDVFLAMGPYAASQPWSAFVDPDKPSEGPEAPLLRARAQCHVGPPSVLPGGGAA